MIVVRATGLGFLRREERGNALPVLIGELEGDGLQPLRRRTVERSWLVRCPSPAVTDLGTRLMAATKGRPGLLTTLRRWLSVVHVARMQLDTLRLHLLKIGGWVTRHHDGLHLHLAASHLGEHLWHRLAARPNRFVSNSG